MNSSIKIALVDDHQMLIDGIKSLLSLHDGIEVVGELNSGKEACKWLIENTIDLLVTDISMPEMNGIELTKWVKSTLPQLPVLVLSMHDEREIISEILLAEAEGYVLKNTGRKELINAITEVAGGGTYYAHEVFQIMMQKVRKQVGKDKETAELTPRELEIIQLIVQEYTTAQMSEMLCISGRTIDTHRKHILEKTKSRTIVGLMKFAFRNGLIS